MKTLLFIIPSLKTGGTNASLDALYSHLKEDYNISVFAISHQPRDHNYLFDEVLMPQDGVLSLLYSDYSKQKGIHKLYAFFCKILQSLLRIVGVDLGMFYARRVIKRLENQNHYNHIVAYQEGYATKFSSLFSNPNKIAWIHCNYDTYLPQGKSEEAIYNRFEKIVCVSEYTASVFKRRYPALSEKVLAIHNMIDEERIKKLAETQIDDSRFVTNITALLSAGRFSTVKRFRDIPRVALELKKRGLQFVWYILGPQDGSNEYAAFWANMEKYGVQDCVKWLGGKSNPYPYFKASDVYVCLSESEACPMVFKEAKMFGLPIVTTDFPSAYEFIHEKEGVITTIEELPLAITKVVELTINNTILFNEIDEQSVIQRLKTLFD